MRTSKLTAAEASSLETVVIDASAMFSLLVNEVRDAAWVQSQTRGRRLAAPSILPFEVLNVVRRRVRAGHLAPDDAAIVHRALQVAPIAYTHFAPLADRIWALRDNLTAYDAAYVSLAELLQCPLVTLDARIASAPGLRCEVRAYPG